MKRRIEIKSVSLWRITKLVFITSFVCSLFFLVVNVVQWLRGLTPTFCSACTFQKLIGAPTTLAAIVFLISLLYNIASSRLGGIQITIEDKENE